uniref:Helix-turn-helix domain-containing protein n=2 Tax=Lygus hesperus TaxID=30085 RepID=A0A0K8SCX8_LYGHE
MSCGKIETKWWQKPQNKGRYINYQSQCPYHQKINFVQNLINRVRTLSSPKFHKECENKIVDILLLNNYPHYLICKLLKQKPKSSEPSSPTQNSKFYSLTYVKHLSEKLNKVLTSNNETSKIAFKNHATINKILSKTKDPVQKDLQSDLVYQIPCECGLSYIGQTHSHLKVRIRDHKNSIKPEQNRRNGPDPTALCTHAKLGHTFDFDKTKILTFETQKFKRELKEMISIERNKNKVINKRNDVQNLSKCYSNLINSTPRNPPIRRPPDPNHSRAD